MKQVECINMEKVMNPEDYKRWVEMEEKGRRLAEIINNPKAKSQHKDASRGMKKIGINRRMLLRKYGIIEPKR